MTHIPSFATFAKAFRPLLAGWFVTAGGLALAAPAAPAGCPGVFITGGYVRAPAPGAGSVAAYGTIENSTSSPVTITGVTASDFASASLHRSTSGGGMAGMTSVENLVVPAKGSVELAPGGTHVMLMGPAGVLRPKDTVRLKFQCGGGSLPVTLPVEAAG